MSIDKRILDAFAAENGFPLEQHLLVLALMGSKSHGTYMPPDERDGIDDVDLMGFVVPPLDTAAVERYVEANAATRTRCPLPRP